MLGHLPVLVGFLLGDQVGVGLPAGVDRPGRVPVGLPERELPGLPVQERDLPGLPVQGLVGPLADTGERRRPRVQGRPGDLLLVMVGVDNWGIIC